MEKVSIIVPVYNKLHRLNPMVESILAQSYTDLELLLVDDGSTDGSHTACDIWAARDPRIRVFHQNNRGVSCARNTGIQQAQGKYLMFCDADDCLLENAVLSLVQGAEETHGDLLIGGITEHIVDEKHNTLTVKRSLKRPLTVAECSAFSTELQGFWGIDNMASACGKLFLRKVIAENGLSFPPNKIVLEDLDFVLSYLDCCSKIASIPSFVYLYYQTAGICVWEKRSSMDFVDDVSASHSRLEEFIAKHGIENSTILWDHAIAGSAHASYQGLWSLPTPTKEAKKAKYRRIKEVLSYPLIQKYLSTRSLPPTERFLLRKNHIFGLLCLYKLRTLCGKG